MYTEQATSATGIRCDIWRKLVQGEFGSICDSRPKATQDSKFKLYMTRKYLTKYEYSGCSASRLSSFGLSYVESFQDWQDGYDSIASISDSETNVEKNKKEENKDEQEDKDKDRKILSWDNTWVTNFCFFLCFFVLFITAAMFCVWLLVCKYMH